MVDLEAGASSSWCAWKDKQDRPNHVPILTILLCVVLKTIYEVYYIHGKRLAAVKLCRWICRELFGSKHKRPFWRHSRHGILWSKTRISSAVCPPPLKSNRHWKRGETSRSAWDTEMSRSSWTVVGCRVVNYSNNLLGQKCWRNRKCRSSSSADSSSSCTETYSATDVECSSSDTDSTLSRPTLNIPKEQIGETLRRLPYKMSGPLKARDQWEPIA